MCLETFIPFVDLDLHQLYQMRSMVCRPHLQEVYQFRRSNGKLYW